ncbi:hypothetical protein GCM10010420_48020 [Streptomyces glaucosporus]|uniref:Uncharacterized protein n=1 Tax=Streptomyces glaucosporus TaxID=284044 RepID=A0ABN3ISU7_9ACTN
MTLIQDYVRTLTVRTVAQRAVTSATVGRPCEERRVLPGVHQVLEAVTEAHHRSPRSARESPPHNLSLQGVFSKAVWAIPYRRGQKRKPQDEQALPAAGMARGRP